MNLKFRPQTAFLLLILGIFCPACTAYWPDTWSDPVPEPLLSPQLTLGTSSEEPQLAAPHQRQKATSPLKPQQRPLASEDLEHSLDAQSLDAEGFCQDDIYTRYLKEKYKKSHTVGSKTRSKKWYQLREKKALHYAASHLAPRPENYFGTLPIVITPEVEYWISFFKSQGRSTFHQWLERGEAYKRVMYTLLKREGMPVELYFLSMIESGFNNKALSKAQATGPWQFIAATARTYGLEMNYWVDERKDPVKSTIAAASLLRDLYKKYGDWYLAMAAYNAGPGKIDVIMKDLKTQDYWKISRSGQLSQETSNFVPKMLAALVIGVDPQKHGFSINPKPEDYFPEHVQHIGQPIKLAELASKLGINSTHLAHWNPELNRGITPPRKWSGNNGYPLRLPAALKDKFDHIYPLLAKVEVKDVRIHRVAKGETLSHIAQLYKVSIQKILRFNANLSPVSLRTGKDILIPLSSRHPSP